jgi:hypothetical protein
VISDLTIGMNNGPFNLSVELDCREIDKHISVSDSGGDIILNSVDFDFEAMDWKLYLSPRLIFTAIINGIATYPESVYAAINEQKRDISSDILDAIREILNMETNYPGAWEPFSSDFQIKIAKQEYARFFQRCGDFSLERWKITRKGIEIRIAWYASYSMNSLSGEITTIIVRMTLEMTMKIMNYIWRNCKKVLGR